MQSRHSVEAFCRGKWFKNRVFFFALSGTCSRSCLGSYISRCVPLILHGPEASCGVPTMPDEQSDRGAMHTAPGRKDEGLSLWGAVVVGFPKKWGPTLPWVACVSGTVPCGSARSPAGATALTLRSQFDEKNTDDGVEPWEGEVRNGVRRWAGPSVRH